MNHLISSHRQEERRTCVLTSEVPHPHAQTRETWDHCNPTTMLDYPAFTVSESCNMVARTGIVKAPPRSNTSIPALNQTPEHSSSDLKYPAVASALAIVPSCRESSFHSCSELSLLCQASKARHKLSPRAEARVSPSSGTTSRAGGILPEDDRRK